MTTDYERHLIVSYLANAAARLRHRDRAADALAEWVMENEQGVAFASRRLRSRLDRANIDPDDKLSRSEWRVFQHALREERESAAQPKPDLTARRLQRLAETTGLDRTDVAILELLLRYHTQPVIESMIDDVTLGAVHRRRELVGFDPLMKGRRAVLVVARASLLILNADAQAVVFGERVQRRHL